MKINNCLPLLVACLEKWEKCPTERQFANDYAIPMQEWVGDFFEDFHGVLLDLDWNAYRSEALRLSPEFEENRLRAKIRDVENLFGFKLEGEANLMGAFTAMDGYARFDRGTHRVYLGVDESHARGRYLDVLTVHELTHVARESRPEVWEGFGLNPKMTQAEFTECQPVIEHLMGEGFSCVVSEILVPGEPHWTYAYQSQESMSFIYADPSDVNKAVHRELKTRDGDYGRLYRIPPAFAHYVWAWRWVKKLLADEGGGDPKRLVSRCSKEWIENALSFELR